MACNLRSREDMALTLYDEQDVGCGCLRKEEREQAAF